MGRIRFAAMDFPDIVRFRETVANALLQEKYKPADALYFFQKLDDFVAAAERFHQFADEDRKIRGSPVLSGSGRGAISQRVEEKE